MFIGDIIGLAMLLTCLIGDIVHEVTSAKLIKTNQEWVSLVGPPAQKPRACPDCNCGVGKADKRIIGGASAKAKEYPWIAYVQSQISATEGFACGSSILNSKYALTAAHCIKTPIQNISMFLGTHDLEHIEKNMVKTVLDVKIHERYNMGSYEHNDIALIKFDPPADFSAGIDSPDYMRPVCLPEAADSYVGEEVIAIGWGFTKGGGMSTDQLQIVKFPVVDEDTCIKTLGGHLGLDETQFCAGIPDGGKGTCKGDSGGPILREINGAMEEIGITSFGKAKCVSYGVYTRVDKYLDWIEENMDDADVCSCTRP